MAVYHDLDWLFAVGTLFFILSVWGIGANDVANSYATSVSSRSLTLIQAGILATITEFIGAIALGQQVTSTIRSGVFSVDRFLDSPGVLIMAMVVAEVGSSIWLTVCTYLGFPVSTTQSIVGALIGVAIAAELPVHWGWKSQSVSQIAASWGIAPLISAAFGAIIFTSIRLLVHSREDPMKWALRALFIVVSGGHGIPKLEDLGAGKACGIVIGVFAGVWVISAVFFVPYYWRSLVKGDSRLRFWHIPMGPLLWKDNYTLYFPGNPDKNIVPNYYESDMKGETDTLRSGSATEGQESTLATPEIEPLKGDPSAAENDTRRADASIAEKHQKELQALDTLPWIHPKRIFATLKLVFTYGITRDVIHHQSMGLDHIHQRAPVFDNKVEHLWTTAQVCSAMIMSISHGANDVSNAIGPFTTEYMTWHSGKTSTKTDTPIWIKAVGGLGLGFGFWTFGYHIMRSLGNRITKHSPTRGFSMELSAALTVLLASRLGLPVSTTQCITGAVLGVALVNMDLRSINWKQLGKIFFGWVLTLPCAGLISGIIMGMALNVPTWGR
ncbi:hypothetical protein N7519_004018 [Penicillium mononematosum]|uniref:uncharacterized protein n=1 Tax=Penicillium mononematosum TaxID=268346 RepID=UPI0025473053|nr:uncharacterized protein N7519_004018 [Penicillium mononematosum]KAJ6189110.1 hypothetical protein N7519_004018 [Penicillium mononematosum]